MPLLSKSLNVNWTGSVSDPFIWELVPKFPAIRSISPSLSTSTALITFQKPPSGISKYEAVTSENPLPLLLWKTRIGINSPAITRSGQPSLFRSIHSASVTMPPEAKSGRREGAQFVKRPVPSFIRRKLSWGLGYSPGIILPPTNRSMSPSPSISAATHDFEISIFGR